MLNGTVANPGVNAPHRVVAMKLVPPLVHQFLAEKHFTRDFGRQSIDDLLVELWWGRNLDQPNSPCGLNQNLARIRIREVFVARIAEP